MDIDVDTTELQRLAAKYANAGPVIKDELNKGMNRSVLQIEGDAKRLAPVLTGHLRRSITHEVQYRGDAVTGEVGTNVVYAKVAEFGFPARGRGKGRKAHPYLHPAIEKNRVVVNRELGPVLIKRVMARLGAS